jgi:hypothetical protein
MWDVADSMSLLFACICRLSFELPPAATQPADRTAAPAARQQGGRTQSDPIRFQLASPGLDVTFTSTESDHLPFIHRQA